MRFDEPHLREVCVHGPLHARIDEVIAAHIERLGYGLFVRRAELEECLSVIDPDTHVLALTRYTPRHSVNRSPEPQLVHRLSFEWRDGRIRPLFRPKWSRKSTRLTRYQDLLKEHDIVWQHPLILLIPPQYKFPEAERVRLQQHLNLLVTQTQIWRNIQKDHSISIVHEYCRRARHKLERPRGVSLDTVCTELAAQFGGTVAVATRILAQGENPEAFSKFIYQPGPFRLSLCKGLRRDQQRLLRLLNDETIQHLCKEALQRAKVIDATDDANALPACDPFSHFLILPLARSTNTKARRLELILLMDTDRGRPRLSHMDVLAAQEIVAMCDSINLKTQGLILSDLTYLLSHVRSRPEAYWGRSPEAEFRSIALDLCEALVGATQAHSCTFRLVNGSRRDLVKIASHDESGGWQKCQQISLGQASGSLNVFTYFNHRRFDGLCYVPISNCIPKSLSSHGLGQCLPCRPGTQSEICFAIVQGTLAVGTINLESPSLHGFDDDLPFLRSVATVMSSIYAILVDLYDSKFISERLALLNRHHDLKNHVDFIETVHPPLAQFLKNRYLPDLFAPQGSAVPAPPRYETFTFQELIDAATVEFRAHGKAALKEALDIRINPTMPTLHTDAHYRRVLGPIVEQLVSNMILYNRRAPSTPTSLSIDYELQVPKAHGARRTVASGRARSKKFPTRVLRYGVAYEDAGHDILIVMKYSFTGRPPPALVRNLGRRPVINPESGKVRLGFYLLGLIVRKLGGLVRPLFDPSSQCTQVTITIPMTLRDSDGH